MSETSMGRRGFLAACLGLAAAPAALAAPPAPRPPASAGGRRWHPARPYRPEEDGPILEAAAAGPLPAEQLHRLLLWASPPCVQQPRPGGGVLWRYSLRTAAEMTLVAAGYVRNHLAAAGPGQGRQASFTATVMVEPDHADGPQPARSLQAIGCETGGKTEWVQYRFAGTFSDRKAELSVFPVPDGIWHMHWQELGHFRDGTGQFTASPVVFAPPIIQVKA